MDNPVDLLQIKIEQAKRKLPEETLNAIAAVDWQAAIIGMREKKGYSFEQLGDLEIETELLLCGLLNPEDYPRELEKRMGISKAAANELVNEMNNLVFKKIREELIKNTERKRIFAKKSAEEKSDAQVFSAHGIEIIPARIAFSTADAGGTKPDLTLPELKAGEKKTAAHPILAQKISGSFQIPMVKTDHSLQNLQPSAAQNTTVPQKPIVDPYREMPE